MSSFDFPMQAMEVSRLPPFSIEEANPRRPYALATKRRPEKPHLPFVTATPTAEHSSEVHSMTGLLVASQYFNNLDICTLKHLHPKGPAYMSTHLRTILKHFGDPACAITTDIQLPRDLTHLAALPTNYPWLFSISIYQSPSSFPASTTPSAPSSLPLISTRHFFRDLEGEVGSRPYIEITQPYSLEYLGMEFVEEKSRTGIWKCEAETPWGHFEHWGRQYVVRFLKRKAREGNGFGEYMGSNWGRAHPFDRGYQ